MHKDEVRADSASVGSDIGLKYFIAGNPGRSSTIMEDMELSYLEFTDLAVTVSSKEILKGVSGIVYSGDLLAVMGPTGSGKTTLLNTLAGKIPVVSGSVHLNGLPFDKALRRRLGYVMQSDVFLPNLTLWETLYFIAMVRIPDRFTKEEKTDRINIIVKFLGLQKCLQTVIGRTYSHGLSGLSGGEKKRASIACELLTDPDILLLDEPTSGLDSSTAHTLMVQLKNYATGYNKTIVATIHQPSSQVFHMFSTLLLLVEGEMAYFGHASSAMGYFTDLGMPCIPDYNPADFLLELLTSDSNAIELLKEKGKTIRIYSPVSENEQPVNRRYSYTGDGTELKQLQADNDVNPKIHNGNNGSFPVRQETDVIRKERSVGSYRLSAYYLSKITSELPLLLVIPTLFNTAVYWAAGLGGVGGYFAFCGLGILNCLLIQGVAHIIGVCITDLTLSMLIMDCFNIGGLLLGKLDPESQTP
ncbi:ABC transporter G family member 27-like [Mizuhopecten yessoensis]|uniref:ABC transporter G family member 27-like n=1 Tax=Mizuhopecten yessoensis TaxID=6573 RepID=UPI000B4585BB|nr:ABC transporter G family member 27-like [Mizuhopecten yessoensis]